MAGVDAGGRGGAVGVGGMRLSAARNCRQAGEVAEVADLVVEDLAQPRIQGVA
ncbi:hypothetical protein E4N62_20900 [Streptomyces sp. MNU76]|uniref:hypothetical protein n=1 Tax=Streptomyces sp. MNU76 TaxID=2560026 RepID=UPI001E321AF1|nr:hypothetical protein [Streptomyces sp. MNU76]MCC9707519.1 hypothetical protein [Streptomyces sp. MNU76]